jgi:hypothetical protein
MKRCTYFIALALAFGMLLACGARAQAVEAPAKVDGTWDMEAKNQRGTFSRTLILKQTGSTIKGTLAGLSGTSPLEGTVTGNKISFTVKRETPTGTFTMEYAGTVDGDTMKGTTHSEGLDGEWTATRAK